MSVSKEGGGGEEKTTDQVITEEVLKIFILDDGPDDTTFIANHLGDGTWITKNVYGGALFAQSLIAAEKTVDPSFILHSIHCYFILNVSTDAPVTYKIQKTRDGRSFCTRLVQAEQSGKFVYSAQVSFQTKAETGIYHQRDMPQVKPPEECKATWDIAKEYLEKAERGDVELGAKFLKPDMLARIAGKDRDIIEFRPVNPDIQLAITPHKPQPFYYWCRVRIPLSNDQRQHQALVAYLTDATLVTAANRPHISHGYTPSMLVSLDHTAWFHIDDYRADEWMLYENESPIATNGRAFSTGRLWTRDGRIICSVAQESLSRTRNEPSRL